MAKCELYHQLSVKLPRHSYPIYIARGSFSDKKLLQKHLASSQALIVTNDRVAPKYLKPIQEALNSVQCDVVVLPDGESHKNQKSLNLIYETLIKKQHHRDTTIFALGGGVVGDMAGFAAATYQRGVNYIQLPTTLLAQVDSSVGGKTAINHPMGKNLIGSFYQPHAVIMDIQTLESLPERELKTGMAEVIKYGLLAGGKFLNEIESILSKELSSIKPTDFANLIAACCRLKAQIVEADEYEAGQRALLNLGHTFAHALEAYTNYSVWRHGEAVAIGLFCAAILSNQLGFLSRSNLERIDSILSFINLPRRIPKDVDLLDLCDLMYSDKKVKNNRLRFILMKAPGDCFIYDNVTRAQLQEVLELAQS